MAGELRQYPTPREGVASRVVDGLAVAVTPEDSTLHTFENPVATAIWQLVDGRHSVAAIVERVVATYEVERERAERDVLAFVGLLAQRGLVELSAEARS